MKNLSKEFIFLLFIPFLSRSYAQWIPNTNVNTPVCIISGKQNDARIMEDGFGGAFIAWKDARNGNINPDIYMQRMDSSGFALWATNGVAVCFDTTDQSTPNICADMNGGAIIAWSDRRNNGDRDIYAQRIDANGNILWQANGVSVAIKPMREHNEKIVSDGSGGAIIVWEQFDTINFLWDVWAQRISASGAALWPNGGIPVCNVTANRLNPKIQKDKKGGAIITWQDFRNGLDYDIYAQRINSAGVLMWGSAGISVAAAPGPQINPKIDPDSISGGAYVAWQDKRNGTDYDIYCQRMDSSGTASWAANGVSICSAPANQSALDMLSNSVIGGAIITWKDARSGNEDIYVQKINSSGIIQWPTNGIGLAVSPFSQKNPNVCSDGSDGAIITWQDSTVNDWDIKAQKINSGGVVQWTTNGVVVSDAIEIQGHPKNIPDGRGGSIFVFQDKRTNIYDIYCHRICWDGYNVGAGEYDFFSEMRVFPNPFHDHFSLTYTLENDDRISVKLFNFLGQVVNEIIPPNSFQKVGAHTVSFAADFPAGVYFLKLSSEKNFISTIVLVKE